MFTACLLIMSVASVRQNNQLMGYNFAADKADTPTATDTMTVANDGTITINTAPLCTDVKGFNGAVPLAISIKDHTIISITALPNSETPSFFDRADTLLHAWDGKTLHEACATEVDAVSGATFSSRAIIENARRGFNYAMAHDNTPSLYDRLDLSARNICALVVMLMAMIVPLCWKNRKMRTIQLILNITILGLWCSTFLCHSIIISVLSGGFDIIGWFVVILMLATAFIYPLFGKKSYYCTHVCPLGSAQELAGRIPCKKLRISPQVARGLNIARRTIWAILMLLLITGVWSEWIHYEPFVAFSLQTAEVGVIIFAALTLVISAFVPRAYCRFVCPTGTLLKLAQNQK